MSVEDQTEEDKRSALMDLVREERGTVLVYTATVRAAKQVWADLLEAGLPAGLYHGDLGAKARDATQDAFMDGRYRIVVATKAFGMGIDKPDTRLVVHYQVPGSIEGYYQEVGRAGRDGAPARGILLYRRADARVQRFFLISKHPRPANLARFVHWLSTCPTDETADNGLSDRLEQVVRADLERLGLAARNGSRLVLKADHDKVLVALNELYDRRRAEDKVRLEQMLRFAELRSCRTSTVLRYFGEEAAATCTHCDYCTGVERRSSLARPHYAG